MANTAELFEWKGTTCVKLSAGGYEAWVANEIGSNVIRLRDNANGLEFFRFSEDNTADTIKQSAEVWGLPTLYLPLCRRRTEDLRRGISASRKREGSL